MIAARGQPTYFQRGNRGSIFNQHDRVVPTKIPIAFATAATTFCYHPLEHRHRSNH